MSILLFLISLNNSIDDYIKMYDGRMENSSESVFETQLVYGFKAYWSDENGETSNLMSMFPRISWAQYLRPRKTDSYDIVNMLFEAGDGRREGSILISGQDQIYYHKADKVSVFPDTSIYKDWRLDVLVPGAYQTRKFLPYDATYWTKGGRFFDNGVSINVPVIRYAEVILNRAEALAENDQLAEAWTQLERIRTRAGLSMDGISNANKTALLDQIKKEYAQMVVEGMDMKLLIEFAEDTILENIKNYDYEDMKEEIEDIAGEDVWADLSAT